MLRNLVLVGAACLAVAGVTACVAGFPGGFAWLAMGVLVLVGTLFARARYKRLADAAPTTRFERTNERFRDESSGDVVTVYADPETGERSYVREMDGGPRIHGGSAGPPR